MARREEVPTPVNQRASAVKSSRPESRREFWRNGENIQRVHLEFDSAHSRWCGATYWRHRGGEQGFDFRLVSLTKKRSAETYFLLFQSTLFLVTPARSCVFTHCVVQNLKIFRNWCWKPLHLEKPLQYGLKVSVVSRGGFSHVSTLRNVAKVSWKHFCTH